MESFEREEQDTDTDSNCFCTADWEVIDAMASSVISTYDSSWSLHQSYSASIKYDSDTVGSRTMIGAFDSSQNDINVLACWTHATMAGLAQNMPNIRDTGGPSAVCRARINNDNLYLEGTGVSSEYFTLANGTEYCLVIHCDQADDSTLKLWSHSGGSYTPEETDDGSATDTITVTAVNATFEQLYFDDNYDSGTDVTINWDRIKWSASTLTP